MRRRLREAIPSGRDLSGELPQSLPIEDDHRSIAVIDHAGILPVLHQPADRLSGHGNGGRQHFLRQLDPQRPFGASIGFGNPEVQEEVQTSCQSLRQRLDIKGEGSGAWLPVSRLGMPLVNEVVVPLAFKDQYNRTSPKDDVANIAGYVVDPELSRLLSEAGWNVEACYGNIATRQAFGPSTGMNIVAQAA